MRKTFLVLGITLAVCTLAVLTVGWMQAPKLYSSNELSDLQIHPDTRSGFSIHFLTNENSGYFPLLISYEKKDNQVLISVFKQLKISPWKGIAYTPPPHQTLLDFNRPQKEITSGIFDFGLANPEFILKAQDGEFPIKVQ